MIVGVVRETKRKEHRVSHQALVESGANLGLARAIEEVPALKKGLNTYCPPGAQRGSITCQAVADSLGLAYEPVDALGGKG